MGGFRYRRRAGGMRQEAERQRPAILAGMRRRLGPALRPRNLLRLEAEEVPRFLLLHTGSSGAEMVVDPLRPALPALPRDAARRRLVEASRHPKAVHAPPFLHFASAAALDTLAAGWLRHNTVWQAEILLREAEVVSVTLAPAEGGRLSVERGEGAPGEKAALLIFRSQPFAEAAALGSATRRGATLRVTLPPGSRNSHPARPARGRRRVRGPGRGLRAIPSAAAGAARGAGRIRAMAS
ncbi:hypothetical protein ACFQX4_16510 [Roseomonas sp. GCM10028921]